MKVFAYLVLWTWLHLVLLTYRWVLDHLVMAAFGVVSISIYGLAGYLMINNSHWANLVFWMAVGVTFFFAAATSWELVRSAINGKEKDHE